MTEAVVDLGNGREPLRIRLNGADATFRLRADRIAAALVRPIEPRLQDLLDIAAYLFAADSRVTRGRPIRPRMGEGWQRRLDFHIPVRDVVFWSRPTVVAALIDAVSFLTGDIVSFTFSAGAADVSTQSFLDFDANAAKFTAEKVLLFSGGLDSFAGALETLSTSNARIVLVTHRSSQKAAARQRVLGNYLKNRFPDRVLQIHVAANNIGGNVREATQRSRSFLFAVLGQVVARMFGAQQQAFFENGIIGHNLPISPQVVGTMATRTTHPFALRKLENLMMLVGDGAGATIRNPYEWLTKTDVVRRIAEHGAADQIRYAVSCTSIREQNNLHTHCGACSQCLDRRFAMYAAGLAADDPPEMYATDVLFGSREKERSRTMALEWTRHAVRLVNIDEQAFLSAFGQEAARLASGYPEARRADVTRRIVELHRRHGGLVVTVLETAIRENADRLVRHDLPESALVRLHVADATTATLVLAHHARMTPPAQRGSAEASPDAPDQVPDPNRPLEVTFGREKGRFVIIVQGLGRVEGAPARTAHELRYEYDADRQENRPRAKHRYVAVGALAIRLETSKDAIAQHVGRCRRELAQFYEQVFGSLPTRNLLIETQPGRGYRLDPDIRIIEVERR